MGTAIVTDMILEEVEALFEQRVVTPSTLFAANSLAQAVVLHDRVFLGMVAAAGASLSGGDFVQDAFSQLRLGQEAPRRPDVVEAEFDIGDATPLGRAPIMHWLSPDRFTASTTAVAETGNLEVVLDYLRVRRLSDIIQDAALLDNFGVEGGPIADVVDPGKLASFNEEVRQAGGKDFYANDLTVLRDIAWLAAAGITVAWARRYEVYHALLERPFYAGQLPRPGGPLELVQTLAEQDQLSHFWAQDMVLPPFFGMVVSDPRFSVADFWALLWASRERHAAFRQAIAQFEAATYAATSQRELSALLADHRASLQALIERRQYQSENRLLYTVSGLLTSAGKSVLKDLEAADRADKKIARTGGLVRLWDDVGSIAPATQVPQLLQRHFGRVPDPRAWSQVHTLVKQVNSAAGLQGA
jgi:hypothetical protein